MCCGSCENAARRDPDPWRNASVADEHAHKLEQIAFQTRPQRQQVRYRESFARNAYAAAEAFEVAADAWEEVDDTVKAKIRRDEARRWYMKAFITTHRYVRYGHHLLSDAEARELAARIRSRPPRGEQFLSVPLSHVGPIVELRRLQLNEREMWEFRRKRPWVYAARFL